MINDRQIAKRYAKAFVNDKVDAKTIDRLNEETSALAHVVVTDEHVKDFFLSPLNSKKTKIDVMKSILKKLEFSDYTFSLLEMLIQKDRFPLLATIAQELGEYSDVLHNRVRVNVTTAVEPSKAELDEISRQVSAFFNKEVIVHRDIDQSIIGGFVIEGEGRKLDMSVAGQIKRILSRV